MFIGHFAVALAAKRLSPRTSLGTLFAAGQLLDLIWPVLVLLGVETVRIDPGNTAFTPLDFTSYPWTHSLLLALAWAAIFAFAYRARTRSARGAWVVGGLVLSHWVLDLATHRPDLPLAPGAVRVGLGLWNSIPATLLVEGGLFLAGTWLYWRSTRPRNRIGTFAFWPLIVLLVAFYAANILGPPPPSERVVAVACLSTWLFVPWAAWIDRNREPAPAAAITAAPPPDPASHSA